MNLKQKQIAARWNEGYLAREIAALFSVSMRYVFKVRRQLGLKRRKRGPRKSS